MRLEARDRARLRLAKVEARTLMLIVTVAKGSRSLAIPVADKDPPTMKMFCFVVNYSFL